MVILDETNKDLIIPSELGNNRSYIDGYENGMSEGLAQGRLNGIAEQKDKLEEVTIVENGVYEREDGYKKVTVNTPGVTSIDVGADGIRFGYATWSTPPAIYDFTNLTGKNAYQMFYNCKEIVTLPSDIFGGSQPTSVSNMFNSCIKLIESPVIDLTNATSTGGMFDGCTVLEKVNLVGTSASSYCQKMFQNCKNLKTITLLDFSGMGTDNKPWYSDECYGVFSNLGASLPDGSVDITFANIKFGKVSSGMTVYGLWDGAWVSKWSDYTIQSWVDALYDYSGGTKHNVQLSTNFKNRLTEEQLATVTAKNWVIS